MMMAASTWEAGQMPQFDPASTLTLTTASLNTHTGPGQAAGPWETRQPQPERRNDDEQLYPHQAQFTWPSATPPPRPQEHPPVEEDTTTTTSLPCSSFFFWVRWPRP